VAAGLSGGQFTSGEESMAKAVVLVDALYDRLYIGFSKKLGRDYHRFIK